MEFDDPEEVADAVQEFLVSRSSFLTWMGSEVEEVGPEGAVMRLPYREEFGNGVGVVHGGVTATLMDAAGTLSLRPHLENPFEDLTASINLNVNYLEAADSKEDVVTTAEVVRAGDSVGVVSMTAEQGEDLIAVGQGAYRLFGGGGSGSDDA
jgi:uncharacterized protein (TIGR00369 family)